MLRKLSAAAAGVAAWMLVSPVSAEIPDLAILKDFRARRAASTDATGANHDHVSIAPGQTVPIADLDGPGVIAHCWFTIASDSPTYLSRLVLRIRWDDAEAPAVEAPWGPFFGLGHDECADVVSSPIVVMAARAPYINYPPGRAAFNCYFPMPFRKRARIEVTNGDERPIGAFFHHIDWQRHEHLPEQAAYFHAQYRSETTVPATHPDSCNTTGSEDYVILDTTGRGHYVGCTLHVEARPEEAGKWYEGDDMIVVDGEPLKEAILGTGSEDYFSMAWGVRRHFQSPYFGTSYHKWPEQGPDMHQYGRFSMYRWHLVDPIVFGESIRVSIEHGHDNDAANRYASVACWYAARP